MILHSLNIKTLNYILMFYEYVIKITICNGIVYLKNDLNNITIFIDYTP